jgi:dTMP kinase
MDRLIVFEGIDGAGTETQSKILLRFLEDRGIPAVRLEYPDYDGPIGKIIHEFLHNRYEFDLNTQFLLHTADRVKDRKKIADLIGQGKVVVCDRYFTSVLGYQCGMGFSLDTALKMAETLEIPRPDKIIYLRISPETSMSRKVVEKGGNVDRNESDKELQGKLSRFYDGLAEKQVWASWFPVDGEKPKEDVFEQVRRILGLE